MSLEYRPGGQGGSEERAGPHSPRPQLNDPCALRGLAHPIRLDLLSIIGRAGRITAADAARELGISHALTSHHLRQLAKYGFVTQIDGADKRERPWQLVHTSLNVEHIEDQPGGPESLAMYGRAVAERALEGLSRWQARRAGWPPGWRRYSGVAHSTVYLAEGELAQLMEAFEELLVSYVDKRPIDDVQSRPPGSKAVDITLIVVPQDPVARERE